MKNYPKIIRTKASAIQKIHQMLDPDILLLDLSKESTKQALKNALKIPIKVNSGSAILILDED